MTKSLRDLTARLNEQAQIINELYIPSQNDYQQRITNIRKSRAQSKNWVQNRFKIQIGINRAARVNPYKEIRKSYLTGLKK